MRRKIPTKSRERKPSQTNLQHTTPPSPPAEAERAGSSYFAPVTFKANIPANSSLGSSPIKALTSPTSQPSLDRTEQSPTRRAPIRAVSPKLQSLTSPAFSLFPPTSPSPPSPDLDNLLDLRKCSLVANTNRPKPKQFKLVPLA